MLIKEYRIPLPLTVEEYRIAQLYMIAKKSREESSGVGSGVEIMVNEPYEDGPGGSGQYTQKIYHVGSHLPGWFKGLLPKSALTVEEMAWNAYPYTKTRFTCPFVQRFSLEIETYYCGDGGHQENVFNLSGSDYRNRVVDVIDVVKDQLHGADYTRDEDPRVFVSQKTGRGPVVSENWIEEYWKEVKGQKMPLLNGKAIMTAYKLCKVEFHYWGMQSKIEKFIHDVALRKTMLRAHRQAWAWQDEWFGLTMEDIREIERQTQEALKKKMAGEVGEEGEDDDDDESRASSSLDHNNPDSPKTEDDTPTDPPKQKTTLRISVSEPSEDLERVNPGEMTPVMKQPPSPKVPNRRKAGAEGGMIRSKASSKTSLNSPSSNNSLDLLASWRMEGLSRKDSDSGSDDEFFDCMDGDRISLNKWSSLELLPQEREHSPAPRSRVDKDMFRGLPPDRREVDKRTLCGKASLETFQNSPSTLHGGPVGSCSTTVLCMVMHAGSALDATMDLPTKKSDVTTFRGAFESVIRQNYPSMLGHVAIKLVPCPSVCTDALGILSSLSPYSFDVYGAGDSPKMTHESVPIGAIPLLFASQMEYWDAVGKAVVAANLVYHEFLRSQEGQGFQGQIVFIGDSIGSVLAYDVLTKHSQCAQLPSEDDLPASPAHGLDMDYLHATSNVPPDRRRSSSSASDSGNARLDFQVSDLFMFGSPLGLVLAHRKINLDDKHHAVARPCVQVYNLFHPTDPLASRLEPLISARFAALAPVNIARYAKYPLGDGQPYHLLESIQCNPHLFSESGIGVGSRRLSDISIQSEMSGLVDVLPLQAISQLTQKWWGNKRLDFALYCPEALVNFPTNSLPHLFHASYWESSDAIAFILRQIGFQDLGPSGGAPEEKEVRAFTPHQPREKWIKKRTSVKVKNVASNHRANDVIVKEGSAQVLKARFMYGPLDMVSLTGEKVDIYVMKDPPAGEWTQLATEVTDKSGRIVYTIPMDKSLSYGIYPVKMIVKGDHTSADLFLTVVPPKTECVVFSIDGSFTASMSVTGRDPRVRAGAVDVTRHWQELGYLIIYVTGRPDMQQQKVVSWLGQHNFPHGLVSFVADGLSTDFQGHKVEYLRGLVQIFFGDIRPNFGINFEPYCIGCLFKCSKLKLYKALNVLTLV
ncbi:unnamed protein product [Allacma fusca]|uniref:DDHD domain-containing protein n=1 Tax=Allacma fusca TaxID=39272 RepID=A0A8J2PXK4_9HEXA|nr:unnamed protein product [Allacma fusca]